MSDYFPIKAGDRVPVFELPLFNADGTPPDLTGATARLTVRMEQTGLKVVNAAAMVIDDPASGVVSYAWAVGDTAVTGWALAEVVVTFPGGLDGTYPNEGYVRVKIDARL